MLSKKLTKVSLFSREDFKSAKRIERIYIWMMEPERFRLSDKDMAYFETLKAAFIILSSTLSMRKAVEMIRHTSMKHSLNGKTISERAAYNVINDVKNLFGDVLKRNKEFDRMVITERIAEIAERAESDGDDELALSAYKELGKFKMLHKEESNEINTDDVDLPQLVVGSNPDYLKIGDVEDARVEEE